MQWSEANTGIDDSVLSDNKTQLRYDNLSL